MKFRIVTVGRAASGPMGEVIAQFESRAARYWPLDIVEVRAEAARSLTADEVRRREGERIVARLTGMVIACDERGRAMTTEAFARWLQQLRERAEDIPSLVERFLEWHGGGRGISVAADALDVLMRYPWPGNIRELENLTKRLVVMAGEDRIELRDVPMHVRSSAAIVRAGGAAARGRHDEVMVRVERDLLVDALRRAGGNRTRAAEELGLAPSTFRDKLAKLGIADP